MRLFLKNIAILFVISFITKTTNAQELKIDYQNAEVNFVFTSKKVKGSFSDVKGTIVLDDKNISTAIIEGSVAVNTIKTGNFIRNRHLMSKKYFYESKYDRMRFKSTEIIKKDASYLIKGMLTIKGISKPVEIDLKREKSYFYGTAKTNSADFDINIDKDKEDNAVEITLKFPILLDPS